jgi:tetratricopeptide (TPR) repeat protein
MNETNHPNVDDVIARGEEAEAANLYDRAIAIYTEAIAEVPNSPDLYYYRGCCRFHLRHTPDALADLTRTLELEPRYLSAFLQRALARYVSGEHRGAIEDNTQVLTFPDLPPEIVARVFYARAMSYRALGDEARAEQDFDAGRHHDPEGRCDPR